MRLRIALALALLATPALAQWQTPSFSTPQGRGTGKTGFDSFGPCLSGVPFVGAGVAANAACGAESIGQILSLGAGMVAKTGAGTYAARTLTAPAAGFTITNPAGTAGNPTFVLADDLAALEALSGTGWAKRTGTSTWTTNTASVVLDDITTTNGSLLCRSAGTWVGIPDVASGVLTSAGSGNCPTYAAAGTGTVTNVAGGYGISGGPITTTGTLSVSLTTASNCIGDTAVANGSYTDGPSMAQGTTGTWDARATISFIDTNGTANNLACKMWDGTSLISSTSSIRPIAGGYMSMSLVGRLASPVANIKVSCKALNATTTLKGADSDGNANATCIWGTRVQ